MNKTILALLTIMLTFSCVLVELKKYEKAEPGDTIPKAVEYEVDTPLAVLLFCPTCDQGLEYLQLLTEVCSDEEITQLITPVAVSAGNQKETDAVMKKYSFNWPYYINEEQEIIMEFGPYNLPVIFLTDKDRVIKEIITSKDKPDAESLKQAIYNSIK